jgi:hypothetical protein
MPSNRLFCFIDWIYAEPDENFGAEEGTRTL